MTVQPDIEDTTLPDPLRPNWLWLTIRFFLTPFFKVWLRYEVRGLEKIPASGGALLLLNHQSHLDPLLIQSGMSRPVSWLARDSLFRIPVIGWILKGTYVLPIDRESAGASSIRKAVQYMQFGFMLGMFPEGTRTRDGSVGEFKPGFVALIRRGNVPVYPVGIAGSFDAFPRNAWFIRPKRVRVVFGDPLTSEEIERLSKRDQQNDLVALVKERIIACQQEAEAWRQGE
ncbi:MAG: 1-acyl-sn-glycerol-3-phosphate acyltransferase [Planctomycetes bacterium]|nr:1-acyl-sn-glycerol-3-phosphate acyltransferase [Planctomycetota bacterium]